MTHPVSIVTVGLLALGTNLPLGRWRAAHPRLSGTWFVAIHASVPVIVAARLVLGVPWPWIPLFVALAVTGQIIGGSRRRAGSDGPSSSSG